MRLPAVLGALILTASVLVHSAFVAPAFAAPAFAANAPAPAPVPGPGALLAHKALYTLTLDTAKGNDVIAARGTMGV